MSKVIGYINKKVIALLELPLSEETPIYIGDLNIDHMKSEHPDDYDKFGDRIEDIISAPDYVAIHPSNGSIQYIKIFFDNDLQQNVMVAIRSTANKKYFARTLFKMTETKFNKYQRSGALIPYIKKDFTG